MTELDKIEDKLQKQILGFSKFLPIFINSWTNSVEKSKESLNILEKLITQLHHVERADIDWMENFKEEQSKLSFAISKEIEECFIDIKTINDSLHKTNNDLKNKLSLLEKSSLALEHYNSKIISGSESQPSLSNILDLGVAFLHKFLKVSRNISENIRLVNFKDKRTVVDLKNSFDINVNDTSVIYYLALMKNVS